VLELQGVEVSELSVCKTKLAVGVKVWVLETAVPKIDGIPGPDWIVEVPEEYAVDTASPEGEGTLVTCAVPVELGITGLPSVEETGMTGLPSVEERTSEMVALV
jgi:hypothetical protein